MQYDGPAGRFGSADGGGGVAWRWVLVLFLALAAWATAGPTNQTLPALDIQGRAALHVTLPFGPTIMAGDHVPVTAELQVSQRLAGTITLQLDQATQIRQSVDAGSSRLQFAWCVPAELRAGAEQRGSGQAQTLRIGFEPAAGGETLALQPVACQVAGGWLRADADGDRLPHRLPNLLWISARPVESVMATNVHEMYSFWQMTPRAVPMEPALLDSMHQIVLADRALDALTTAQLAALLAWTRRGGRLLVAGDAIRRPLDAQETLESLGLALGSEDGTQVWRIPITEVVGASGLETNDQRWGERLTAMKLDDKTVGLETAVTGVALRQAPPWQPGKLTVSHSLGMGRLSATPVHLSAMEPWWREYDRARYLLAQILQRDLDTIPEGRLRSLSSGNATWPAAETAMDLPPISRWVMLGYLGLFALLVTVGDRLLLGRMMRRTHWTWITTLVLVVAFSAAAELISKMSRGRQHRGVSVTLLDYGFEETLTRYSWQAFIPAGRTTFELPTAGERAYAWSPVNQQGGSWDRTASTLRIQPPVWRPCLLAARTVESGTGPFAARVSFSYDPTQFNAGKLQAEVEARPGHSGPQPVELALYYRGCLYALTRQADGVWRHARRWSGAVQSGPSAQPELQPMNEELTRFMGYHAVSSYPLPPTLPKSEDGRRTRMDHALEARDAPAFLRPFDLRRPPAEIGTACIVARYAPTDTPVDGWDAPSASPTAGLWTGWVLLRQTVRVDLIEE